MASFTHRLAKLLLAAVALSTLREANGAEAQDEVRAPPLVYIGSRESGADAGITAARFDPTKGSLVSLGIIAKVERPTWLLPSPHRSILYSVSEVGNDGHGEGSVLSFSVDKQSGQLVPISKVGSGGGGATHLAINMGALPPAMLVANYGTGQVSVVPMASGGVLEPVISSQTDTGRGPTEHQRSAHPHGIAVDLTGRYVLVSDLGADRIFVYRFDPVNRSISPGDPAFVATPTGSGPRHIVFQKDGRFVYANAELTGDLLVYEWNADSGRLTSRAIVKTRKKGYSGELSSSELLFSGDGKFLYVANRGEDALVVFAASAQNGSLQEIQRIPSGGKSPVSFAIDPSGQWLAVANEASNMVFVFSRDSVSGKLAPSGHALSAPRPTSVAFLLK
jgi:6-phosphogluconolactonase